MRVERPSNGLSDERTRPHAMARLATGKKRGAGPLGGGNRKINSIGRPVPNVSGA